MFASSVTRNNVTLATFRYAATLLRFFCNIFRVFRGFCPDLAPQPSLRMHTIGYIVIHVGMHATGTTLCLHVVKHPTTRHKDRAQITDHNTGRHRSLAHLPNATTARKQR